MTIDSCFKKVKTKLLGSSLEVLVEWRSAARNRVGRRQVREGPCYVMPWQLGREMETKPCRSRGRVEVDSMEHYEHYATYCLQAKPTFNVCRAWGLKYS